MILKKFLKLSGISVKEFALQIGTTSRTVHRWSSNERFPKYSELIKIEEITDDAVTARDFIKQYKIKYKGNHDKR